MELKVFECPMCQEVMHGEGRRPFLFQCGSVCCEICANNENCVFCGNLHDCPANELKVLTDLLNKSVVLCENRDKVAVFVENNTLLPYCEGCCVGKVGIKSVFGVIDEALDKIQRVNEQLFEALKLRVDSVRTESNNNRLRVARLLSFFLTGNVFCVQHKRLRAIGVDEEMEFRCACCESLGVVALRDLDRCKKAAEVFVRTRLEEGVREKMLERIGRISEVGTVKMVVEVYLSREVIKGV